MWGGVGGGLCLCIIYAAFGHVPLTSAAHMHTCMSCLCSHPRALPHCPSQITSLKVDAIIRGGLQRFTDMIGQLWVSLGDYYIRAGHFEKARDVYEEAMATVTTVRDFGQVRHR